ncbi:MAG: hypothetical protein V3S71_07440 [Acidobacteriota bacterium]
MKTLLSLQFFAGFLLILSLVSTAASAQQNPRELFEQARMLDEGNQSLTEAIALYRRVATLSTDQRTLAAEAQLRVGLLYERLGQTVEAQRAFAAVVNEYTDQAEAARQAQARMAAARVDEEAASDIIIRQVWAGPGVDATGAPSPDGRHLTFVDWETGDLAVRDLKTEENRRLTNKGSGNESSEFALYSIFSPDGKQVAYPWFNEDFFFDLRLIGLDGTEPRVLYRNEDLEFIWPFDWSADGKQILATFARKDRVNQIVLVSVADGSVQVLKTLDWRYPANISFSPDGRYIVYDFPTKEDAPERDIFVLAADGSHENPLVEHPSDDHMLGWAPDGTRALFASDRTGSWDAWLIPVADGRPRESPELVKRDIGDIMPMGFTQKGSFYYGLRAGMNEVYIATLDPETGTLVDSPTKATQRFVGSNKWPAWSPDGQYLSYLSQRGAFRSLGSRTLVVRSVKTMEERDLPLKGLTGFIQPRWCPDGRSILGTGSDQKRQGIYRVDVQSGDVTLVQQSEPGAYLQQPDCSPDGKTIFYKRNDWTQKLQRIFARDLETGQDRELYRADDIRNLAISPDGRQVAFSTHTPERGHVLKVMPAVGGEPRELLHLKGSEQIVYHSIAWTADGQDVLFAKRSGTSVEEQNIELWRISVDGGAPWRLGALAMEGLDHVRVHPDGRRIAFTAGPDKYEVWVMENFLPGDEGTK